MFCILRPIDLCMVWVIDIEISFVAVTNLYIKYGSRGRILSFLLFHSCGLFTRVFLRNFEAFFCGMGLPRFWPSFVVHLCSSRFFESLEYIIIGLIFPLTIVFFHVCCWIDLNHNDICWECVNNLISEGNYTPLVTVWNTVYTFGCLSFLSSGASLLASIGS